MFEQITALGVCSDLLFWDHTWEPSVLSLPNTTVVIQDIPVSQVLLVICPPEGTILCRMLQKGTRTHTFLTSLS